MSSKAVFKDRNRRQAVFVEWVLDLLIYTVVLNLFVQYVDDFYVENFATSLLVALVLKIILSLVVGFEHSVGHWFDGQSATLKKLKPVAIWGILFGSKFLIIEVIDWLFGHYVDLHNFIALILMIVVMIASRQLLTKIYNSL